MIKFTRDPHIFFTERHDDVSLRYDIDLKKPGKYVLILKFSEVKRLKTNVLDNKFNYLDEIH